MALALVPTVVDRFVEYACSDATLGFIDTTSPLAKKGNLVDLANAGAYGVWAHQWAADLFHMPGCALGCLGVLSDPALSTPGLCQRPEVARFGQHMKIWMDIGTMEYLNAYNHEMHALLWKMATMSGSMSTPGA
jgi:hypothetical protein